MALFSKLIRKLPEIAVAVAGLFALPGLSLAKTNDIRVDNAVLIERLSTDRTGQKHLILEPAEAFRAGDRLIYVLTYRNTGQTNAANLVLTNPLPAAVAFQGTADGQEIVSVDGGRTWGQLGSLKVRDDEGSYRKASLEDVTHIRWKIADAIPAGQAGQLTFRAVVRK